MKLYYMAGACSLVPHTALVWTGTAFEAQAMKLADTKTPDYLALNPQGAVPLLVDGEFVLSQNVAILSYLDEKFPEAKLFGSRTAQGRATAMRWLTFLNGDVHKAFSPLFHLPDYVQDEGFKADMQNHAHSEILRMLAQANTCLGAQDYLADDISVADVYLFVLLRWCRGLKIDYSSLENLVAFYERISDNTGLKTAMAEEGIHA
ncbi:glutathione S-transferase N-terminal domain-containing protein [Moraxella sp. FZFQ2102]|uniref:glutathione S-transferase family protein n=1 Tax=Moraxella sp. FZFQ2102 TaxID=2953752 RepID=UPI00209C1587|nr:glutathione S-transferase N-terminal domain-containing protein [Moraxella sp. FZFQ2102]USZ15006.1 glutathione S-transferase N-terminal domain-containing protein [Moraxella sp. FZFQ2102]